ncbi:MAG: hypothetical protein R3B54_07860 [Bdellovibrionota bacterium]
MKVIIEGEEEIGSDHLETFLARYKEKLQADIIVLTDTENFDVGVPAITTSLRGLVAAEVEVTVMESPKHSGMAGGPLADPISALSKMPAELVDDEGRIAIPGIYDSVRPPSSVEKESYDSLDFTESEYRKRVKLHDSVELIGGKESIPEKLWRLPSLSVIDSSQLLQARVQRGASRLGARLAFALLYLTWTRQNRRSSG